MIFAVFLRRPQPDSGLSRQSCGFVVHGDPRRSAWKLNPPAKPPAHFRDVFLPFDGLFRHIRGKHIALTWKSAIVCPPRNRGESLRLEICVFKFTIGKGLCMKRLLLFFILLAALAVSERALAKGTGYLFISNEKDHTVTVLDGKTFEVVKNIQTGRRPRDMQWSPDKSLLYVGASADSRIDIIDVAKLEVVGYVTPGDDPDQFAITKDGKLLIAANEDDNLATFLDISGNDILDQIPTGVEPEGVILSPDGKRVYITAEVSQMIHVVDMASHEVLADILVGSRPRRAFFTHDGKEYWVTNEISGYVSIIDTESLEVTGEVHFDPKGAPGDVTPVGIALGPDGKTAYVTLGHANRLALVDVATREVLKYLLVGKRAWNLDFSGDNKWLYVVNSGSDDVSIIDVEAGKVVKTVPVGRYPHALKADN